MNLEIRNFDVREASWQTDRNALSNIRKLVFIVEQDVPQEEEWDGRDEESWHWIATDQDGRAIGTARLLPEGQIGRMAVLKEWRGTGVGAALLEMAVEKARHLGFEKVFLHAQTHALKFYEKSGFVADGDEFEDAGIPHFNMTRSLTAPENDARRVPATLGVPDVAIRNFDAAEVEWAQQGKIIRKVRESVLVRELGLDASMGADDDDEAALHWHAQTDDGQTIGVIRMTLDGVIGRLAVADNHRREGVGHALVELAVGKAQRFGWTEVRLTGLASLAPFYEDEGFAPEGDPYTEDGRDYQAFVRKLESENVFDRPRTALSGDDYDTGDVPYRLGEDNRLLLLRREEEFQNVIIEMCAQASQTIRIYSPVLEHKLFDRKELRAVCSALARRNKYTRIEILIYDSHRVVKNGHVLLDLARKLPSSVGIKIVDPELRQLNHEYVLADNYGLIYRHDYENVEGYANFYDLTECNRLGRAFRSAWESGLNDPYLRQLRI